MTDPSKAAMERAEKMISNGYIEEVARYIDTVDRVAREVKDALCNAVADDAKPWFHGALSTIMLPDEPDAKAVLMKALDETFGCSPALRSEHMLTALTAAGYTITKDERI